MPAPSFSVVIPTYQRRDLVTGLVQRLADQEFDGSFEVLVVVDGSDDGTADALRALTTPFRLRVLEQPRNLGPSDARNRGAEEAEGEVVLYLDDDMDPDPRLLAEHARVHRSTPVPAAVFGAYPLHPDSPRKTVIADFIGEYADDIARRLATDEPRWSDVVGGQLSVPRQVILDVGGFDPDCFGNEDWEFGYRVVRAGHALRFNPDAVSRQRYSATAHDALVKQRREGRAAVVAARKHPELVHELFTDRLAGSARQRVVARAVQAAPRATGSVLSRVGPLASNRLERGARDRVSRKLHAALVLLAFWHGVRDAGGAPPAERAAA